MPRPPRRTRAAATATAPVPTSTASKQQQQQQESFAPVLAKDSTNTKNTQNPTSGRRTRRSSGIAAAPPAASATRGPDASGLDILDDDAFAADNPDLDLDLDLDLDDLDDELDAFNASNASAGAAAATAETMAGTHSTTDTSSLFNVGLFRRGRPRQSSVHSRDDAPIRPSSRGGPTTPSLISSTFSLGTFKRRRREPSILGANRRRHRHRRGDASSRHASRDRRAGSHTSLVDDGMSGSELDVPGSRYASDADEGDEEGSGGEEPEKGPEKEPEEPEKGPEEEEPELPTRQSPLVAAATRRSSLASRASRSSSTLQSEGANEAAEADEAGKAPDTSLSSVSNSTSVMLLARTRAKAAQIKKRKSEESQRHDARPKRRATGSGMTALGSDASSVMQSVEVPSSAAAFSTPPRPSSLPASEADRRRFATPGGPDDEVMAPPMSSGSESSSPPMWPSLKALAHGPRRGGRAGAAPAAVSALPVSHETPDLMDDDEDASDLSSPPSLTHSPNYRRAASRAASAKPATRGRSRPAASAAAKKDVAPLTTAALTALLPQRRRRARADDAWSGSDDGELERSALLSEDDDELAHYGGGAGRGGLRRGRSAARAVPLADRTQLTAVKTTKAKGRRAVRRTYGSRSFSSDKENEAADDSTFALLPDDAFEADTTAEAAVTATATAEAAPKTRYFGEELEKAAKKFKEVDQWTLEYESVSRSSSPVGAR